MKRTAISTALATAMFGLYGVDATLPALAQEQPAGDQPAPVATTTLQRIEVTGSRIPRAQIEGPAPITVITADQIKAAGFTSVPDVLRSISQNGGETQSQQSPTGAVTTPGAQQVDLRGLGPNKTLVLINGRRIADFPLPLRGRSNFTDIGNIPVGLIDRIEVLSGSASAVYGSDAIAGVVNFILKKHADGTSIDYQYGDTQHGGGQSQKLTLTTGVSSGDFDAVLGVELLDTKPIWGFQRKIQDSTLDSPNPADRIPRVGFQRLDDYGFALPTDCSNVGHLNRGTTVEASNDYGLYCGSNEAISYGTIQNERKSINAYGSFNYAINDHLNWFADVQLGYGKVNLSSDMLNWEFQDPRDDSHTFYNAGTGIYEYWYRRFTPEEAGGFDKTLTRTTQKNFGIATGFKGVLGENWDYEATFNHSQYNARVAYPRVVSQAAHDLFLGPLLDDYGYYTYNADPTRLFTPLTPAEYASITQDSVFKPKARSDTLSFTTSKTDLFSLPAGPVGFAGVVEYGTQSYAIHPDPHALTTYYYGARYGDGSGDRSHWGIGGELRAPLLENVTLSGAGRYDSYSYGGKSPGKFTYSLGLEWRPVETLLLRGSYGTGFRAPDLHYLFAGTDYFRSRRTDYYNCRVANGDGVPISDCQNSLRRARVRNVRSGDPNLDYETAKSLTAGLVWSPSPAFDVSLDYFDIRVANQIEDMDTDKILQNEASCRLGYLRDGTPVDPNSLTCLNAVSRVLRDANGKLLGVYFQPTNISQQSTAGFDFSTNYRIETGAGQFGFRLAHTHFTKHDSKLFAGDATVDHFAINSGYDIPRNKTSATLSWENDQWAATLQGNRIGPLPSSDSYDQVYAPSDPYSPWIGATYLYNASLRYDFSDHLRLSLVVDNLLDKDPPRDPTYTSYPYYDLSWFDSIGRSYYVTLTYKFGGSAL